jgi:two-component system, sensor histidine kinase
MYSANVSHEMRTPLSTSISFTDLLLTTAHNPVMRKHLEIIKFSSLMMLNNVSDTMDSAQIERGTFTLKEDKCLLKNVVQDIVRVIEM